MYYLSFNTLSPVPLYRQLVDHIEKAIHEGVLHHHEVLPSESDIQKTFSISPIVVKKAYAILAQKHLVESIRGHGTRVIKRPSLSFDYTIFTEHNMRLFKGKMHPLSLTVESMKEPYTLWFETNEPSNVWIQKKMGTFQGFPTYLQEGYFLYQGLKKSTLQRLATVSLGSLIHTLYPNQSFEMEHFYHPMIATSLHSALFQLDIGRPLHHARTYIYDQQKIVAIIFHTLPADYVTLTRRNDV